MRHAGKSVLGSWLTQTEEYKQVYFEARYQNSTKIQYIDWPKMKGEKFM